METKNVSHRQFVGEVYQEVRNDIFSIFRQVCIPEDICEDLVQEVFLKILRLDVIIKEQLKGLAVKIAYQKRIDYLRHRAYINKVQNEGGWLMERSYTSSEAELNDILQVEMKVINCMGDLDCQTYCLSRFEDKSAEEIALQLNLSKRAVESRLYRMRQTMRRSLAKVINY